MSRKIIYIAISLVLLMAFAGCSEASKDIAEINMSGPSKTTVNTSVKFNAYTDIIWTVDRTDEELAKDDDPKNFTWKVEPSDGASINSNGVFIATKPGTYKVTSTYTSTGHKDELHIKVTDNTSKLKPSEVTDPSAPALLRKKSSEYKNKKEEQLFYNGNGAGVENGGKSPEFKLDKPTLVTVVQTYHWNNGQGSSPPGKLSLKDSSGKIYGPWQSVGIDGQGGGKNCYWKCTPNIQVEAGTYTIIDSNPSTWAQNSGSNGLGMSWIFGKQ